MELEMLHEPSPKCPFCRDNYGLGKHLIARRTILGDLVYDCPECCAVYQEKEEKDAENKI